MGVMIDILIFLNSVKLCWRTALSYNNISNNCRKKPNVIVYQ